MHPILNPQARENCGELVVHGLFSRERVISGSTPRSIVKFILLRQVSTQQPSPSFQQPYPMET
jgi:hypothetical protein